ncbi:acyl-CoA dehydrogenase [Roseivivax sp. CAU 1761]
MKDAASFARQDGPEGSDAVTRGLDELRREGLLGRIAEQAPGTLTETLAGIAARDLSLARLVEGHVNALTLIRVHGSAAQRRAAGRAAQDGALFGVWGADGARPAGIEADRLTGAKRYASGLGLVDRALVSARDAAGLHLVLVEAGDTRRHRPEDWDMAGMQASRSGGFDCAGLPAGAEARIGGADAYLREPWFVGGTWRIAALQAGATLGLIERAAELLRGRGHLEAEPHLIRLTPVLIRARAALPAIAAAAERADGAAGGADPEAAAAGSAACRLLTEEIGQAAIPAVEQSVGLEMFARGHPVGEAARDLACYMRQVARDAFLRRVAQHFLLDGRPLLGGAR